MQTGVQFEFQHSPQLAAAIWSMHLLAAIGSWFNALSLTWRLIALGLTACSLVWQLQRQQRLPNGLGYTAEGQWLLTRWDGRCERIVVQPSTLVSRFWVLVDAVIENQGRTRILVCGDMLPDSEFRRLKAALRIFSLNTNHGS